MTSDTVVGHPPDGGRPSDGGADVGGAQPCRVRGVVVRHPLRLPFGVDPGGVVTSRAVRSSSQPSSRAMRAATCGAESTPRWAVWMLTRVRRVSTSSRCSAPRPDRVHDLRGQVGRRPVQGSGERGGRRGQGEDRADLVAVAAQQPGDGRLGQSAAAASSDADPRTSAQRCAPTSGRCAVREAGTAGNAATAASTASSAITR